MSFISRQTAILRRIPKSIWALGFVSLLMDVSSEMIHALLPLYLLLSFGSSMEIVGLIDGLAEATAGIVKLLSGFLSDRIGNRKALTIIGYSLATTSKPIIALAPTVGWILAGRITDRVGKGIRGAPRDAMISDIAPDDLRGASFGLRQSLDTVGAFLGPLIAIGLMVLSKNNFNLVFWIAVVPAVFAPILLAYAVKEPTKSPKPIKKPINNPFLLSGFRPASLGTAYWQICAIAGLYAVARFSESFLIVRLQQTGLPLSAAPIVLVVLNLIYAIGAYPAGALSDQIGRRPIMMIGLVCLIVADAILAVADTMIMASIGILFWGLHLAFTQGTFSALIADTTPPERQATAFGLFTMVQAFALLFANYQAGLLWDLFGPGTVFTLNGAIIGLTLLWLYRQPQSSAATQPNQNGP